MHASRRTTVAVALLAIAISLAGCGDDKNEASGGTKASGAPPVKLTGTVIDKGRADISGDGTKASIEIEVDDNYFKPTYIKAAPGTVVTVEVKNEGRNPHTFTAGDSRFDQRLAPGSVKTVEVTVPDSGSLPFHCDIHVNMGMQGAFYTGAGSASATTTTTSTTAPASSGGGY